MVLAPDVKNQQRHPTLVCAQHTSTFPGASVTGGIGLPTTIDVQLAHHPPPPSAGSFQIAVRTVLPFHITSHGRPTFSESSRVI